MQVNRPLCSLFYEHMEPKERKKLKKGNKRKTFRTLNYSNICSVLSAFLNIRSSSRVKKRIKQECFAVELLFFFNTSAAHHLSPGIQLAILSWRQLAKVLYDAVTLALASGSQSN